MEPTKPTEAEVVAKLAREHEEIELVEIECPIEGEGLKATVASVPVPGGRTLVSIKKFLDEFRTEPEFRQGTAELLELDSFIAHANRFKNPGSALFAVPHPKEPYIVAVIDYHEHGPSGTPRFGSHRGRYAFPISEEWGAWTANDRQPMPPEKFAPWIEERLVDVVDPGTAAGSILELMETLDLAFATPARLLGLSRGITIREGTRVARTQNLATGEGEISFQTEHADADGAPLRVPGAFLLELPVFKGDAVYQLAARLRYRLTHGALVWFFELYRPDRLFDDAFKKACEKAQKETGLPLFVGKPEKSSRAEAL